MKPIVAVDAAHSSHRHQVRFCKIARSTHAAAISAACAYSAGTSKLSQGPHACYELPLIPCRLQGGVRRGRGQASAEQHRRAAGARERFHRGQPAQHELQPQRRRAAQAPDVLRARPPDERAQRQPSNGRTGSLHTIYSSASMGARLPCLFATSAAVAMWQLSLSRQSLLFRIFHSDL